MARPELIELRFDGVSTSVGLHAVLSQGLGFPSWYGRNWDAFWDAITGLVEMPRRLRIVGWSTLQSRLPADAEQLERALTRMAVQYPEFAVDVEYCN